MPRLWLHGRGQAPYRANRRAIRALPLSDPDWPFINRELFTVQPLRTLLELQIPQYESYLIHFGGTYKNMYILQAEWIAKFEKLLSRLCWYRAVVLLEFGALRYEWNIDFKQVGDRYLRDPPEPPTEWSFQCFQSQRNPLDMREAVDGPLDSRYHTKK